MEMLVGKAVCAMCMDANTEEGITREDQRRFASLRGEGHDEGNTTRKLLIMMNGTYGVLY